MSRTMTVDLGDELREFIESLIKSGDYRTKSEVIREYLRLLRKKQAESRLQALCDLLAESLSSGEPVEWEKDAFLKKVKANTRATGGPLNPRRKPARGYRRYLVLRLSVFR